jgi:hypothetical protein
VSESAYTPQTQVWASLEWIQHSPADRLCLTEIGSETVGSKALGVLLTQAFQDRPSGVRAAVVDEQKPHHMSGTGKRFELADRQAGRLVVTRDNDDD